MILGATLLVSGHHLIAKVIKRLTSQSPFRVSLALLYRIKFLVLREARDLLRLPSH
jgi:hypothetical protein